MCSEDLFCKKTVQYVHSAVYRILYNMARGKWALMEECMALLQWGATYIPEIYRLSGPTDRFQYTLNMRHMQHNNQEFLHGFTKVILLLSASH